MGGAALEPSWRGGREGREKKSDVEKTLVTKTSRFGKAARGIHHPSTPLRAGSFGFALSKNIHHGGTEDTEV
jgi:hypothetical protein